MLCSSWSSVHFLRKWYHEKPEKIKKSTCYWLSWTFPLFGIMLHYALVTYTWSSVKASNIWEFVFVKWLLKHSTCTFLFSRDNFRQGITIKSSKQMYNNSVFTVNVMSWRLLQNRSLERVVNNAHEMWYTCNMNNIDSIVKENSMLLQILVYQHKNVQPRHS